MLADFQQSMYSLWFNGVPDQLVEGAITEVENSMEAKWIRTSCSRVYKEYIILNTAVFLLTFMNFDDTAVIKVKDENGEDVEVKLKSLRETGVTSYVRLDSIDSSVERQYFQPALPKGYDFKHFPFGYMSNKIKNIEELCSMSARRLGGVSANRAAPSCSTNYHDQGGSVMSKVSSCLLTDCRVKNEIKGPEGVVCDVTKEPPCPI